MLSALERSQRQRRGSMMLALLGVLALSIAGVLALECAPFAEAQQARSERAAGA